MLTEKLMTIRTNNNIEQGLKNIKAAILEGSDEALGRKPIH